MTVMLYTFSLKPASIYMVPDDANPEHLIYHYCGYRASCGGSGADVAVEPDFFSVLIAFFSSVFAGTKFPVSSLGMRFHPVLKRFLFGSKRGKGCASVLSTI
jgi:hypothetical protein